MSSDLSPDVKRFDFVLFNEGGGEMRQTANGWYVDADDYDALARHIAELTRERDQAIAHDRQPYPTAAAYEAVCAADNKKRERIATLENDAEANRDMLDDARAELDIIRQALGVPVEPHQNLFERVLEAAEAKRVQRETVDRRSKETGLLVGNSAVYSISEDAEEEAARLNKVNEKDGPYYFEVGVCLN